MKILLRVLLGVLLLSLLFFKAFILPLPEGLSAVITHFGEPTRTVTTPGAHFKWPWPIDGFYMFDTRNRVYNTQFTQTLTKDKKGIILLTYIIWNIQKPLRFLQSVGNPANAEKKIEGLVSSSKNNVLGNYNLSNLVSVNKEELKVTEIESKILTSVAERALKNFGVKISKLGIKRIAFPENNVSAIFKQMKAERAQYAAKYRAEGRMKASILLSETELEVTKINAAATKESAKIKGQADREAAEIYAEAHKQGKEFYKFTRSLEALEKMTDQNAVFIVRSDQPPFNVLDESTNSKKEEK